MGCERIRVVLLHRGHEFDKRVRRLFATGNHGACHRAVETGCAAEFDRLQPVAVGLIDGYVGVFEAVGGLRAVVLRVDDVRVDQDRFVKVIRLAAKQVVTQHIRFGLRGPLDHHGVAGGDACREAGEFDRQRAVHAVVHDEHFAAVTKRAVEGPGEGSGPHIKVQIQETPVTRVQVPLSFQTISFGSKLSPRKCRVISTGWFVPVTVTS